jgi:hypothetical protein
MVASHAPHVASSSAPASPRLLSSPLASVDQDRVSTSINCFRPRRIQVLLVGSASVTAVAVIHLGVVDPPFFERSCIDIGAWERLPLSRLAWPSERWTIFFSQPGRTGLPIVGCAGNRTNVGV